MRFTLSLAALVLLAGCSSIANVRDAWNWDPTGLAETPRAVPPPLQLTELTGRIAQLQQRRTEVRSRISAESNVRARQPLYQELHAIGRQLSPLERQLADAAPVR
jgi:outer membrane murein-binding lipoprotein Lpp